MKKILTHRPSGLTLELDSSQIFPDDPGNGTPALVCYKGGTSTYNCAINEGYVDTGRGDISIPRNAINWLNGQFVDDEIEKMYAAGRNGNW